MKITNFVIIFFIVILGTVVTIHSNVNTLSATVNMVTQYNKNIDAALEAAANSVITVSNGELQYNKDEAVENYFNSLYASFGILDDEAQQNAFNVYVPVIVVADIDGFYVRFNYYHDSVVESVWSVRYPYTYKDGNYVINYHLDDTVEIVDTTTGKVYSGNITYLPEKYALDTSVPTVIKVPSHGLRSLYNNYYEYKDYAITHSITEQMNYYANKNNEIAEAFGVSYNFALPVTAESELSRAITDISFISLFQGYPIGVGTKDVYSKFSVAGARILKSNRYYIAGIGGVKYYHKDSCRKAGALADNTQYYATKESCASLGAVPCPYCKP